MNVEKMSESELISKKKKLRNEQHEKYDHFGPSAGAKMKEISKNIDKIDEELKNRGEN